MNSKDKMKNITIQHINKIKKVIPFLESKLKVKLTLKKNILTVIANEFQEYITEKVIEAIDFGFDAEDALLLKNEDFSLEYVNAKRYTPRKNLKDVRARLIGKDGKAKRTIEELTGAVIVISMNTVGIIVDSEHLEQTIQAIISLAQGSKHANVFAYLEKQNANLRILDEEDLGLRDPKKDLRDSV
jgi:ribosomal RNA assembly protein